MAWLRIDDGFASHPKIAALSDKELRIWLRVLCYCARYRTEGQIPGTATDEIPGTTKRLLERFESLGLLERVDSHYVVHDWAIYNPKDPAAADRMRRRREAEPRAAGTEWARTRAAVFDRDQGICADCGAYDEGWNADHEPDRAQLAATGKSIYDITFIKTRCHSCHAKKTRREALAKAKGIPNHWRTQTEPAPNQFGPSRAGTRARPVPSPTTSGEERPQGATPPEQAHYDPLASSSGADAPSSAGVTGATRTNGRKPGDEPPVGDKPKRYRHHLAETWVRNTGHLDPHPHDAIRAEFPDIPDNDLDELTNLATELARKADDIAWKP